VSLKTPIDSYLSTAQHTVRQQCSCDGCDLDGLYKAPKSPGQLNQFYYFCLEHVQAYNKQWNFYQHMTEDEAYKSRLNDYYGERPTWPMGQKTGSSAHSNKIQPPISDVFNIFGTIKGKTQEIPPQPVLTPPQRSALGVLDLTWPLTLKELKKHYKSLAKKSHPDLNPHDPHSLEKFKEINAAYQLLRKILL